MSISLLIEGWKYIPHSYANVNMWQSLALSKLKDVSLYHNDVEFLDKNWASIKSATGRYFHDKLKDIPALHSCEQADVIYRIQFPFDLAPVRNKPVFSFMTCEFGWLGPESFKHSNYRLESLPSTGLIIITPSKWSKAGLERSGAHPDSITIVPLGVDISIFKPIGLEERIFIRKRLAWHNKFVFLHVGAMTPNKGVDLLLKAFAVVNEAYPDTILCLKGLDSFYNSINLLRNANHLLNEEETERVMNNLVYIGEDLDYYQMAELYQSADAYVSPYRGEGFNMPVLEAAACGISVICTAGGSTDDFVDDSFALQVKSSIETENKSILLEPDMDHLIHCMTNVIGNSHFYDSSRHYGPLHVTSNYSWQTVVKTLVEVIRAKSGLI